MSFHIPEDIRDLAGWEFVGETGRRHRINTRKVVLEPRAIDRLPDLIDEMELSRRVWLLADENTFAAAGDRVRRVLRDAGMGVEATVLKTHGGYVGADEEQLSRARAGIWSEAGLYIGVGSGVINDLTRLLVLERGVKYVAVATAASMNGYGSPISAVIEKGVKIVKPTAPTEAIMADLVVLSAAPPRLARSGFGDLLAKNTSNTDWYIDHRITGTYYTAVPVEMVRRGSHRIVEAAPQIRRQEIEGIEVLTAGLIAGAFAMDAAGFTSVASGGEHLISHYLEMVAHVRNSPPAMHGEQVALGTLIASALYEKLERLDIERIDVDRLVEAYPDWPTAEARVRREHGELSEIVLPEVRKQHLDRDQYRQRLETIRREWSSIWQFIRGKVQTVESVRDAYRAAGTPTRASDLAIPPELIHQAYRLARDIRNRYTILHLAADLGVLDPYADEVIARSGVLQT